MGLPGGKEWVEGGHMGDTRLEVWLISLAIWESIQKGRGYAVGTTVGWWMYLWSRRLRRRCL